MGLNPVWPVSLQMGTFGPRDTHVGTPREDESRDQYEVATSQGTPKIASTIKNLNQITVIWLMKI